VRSVHCITCQPVWVLVVQLEVACAAQLSHGCRSAFSDRWRRGRYSFGTGAQALPIPELVPFRLTRQLRGALQPHDACALLAAPLARGLAALRAGRDALEVPQYA